MFFLSKEKRNKIVEKIKNDCKNSKLSDKSLGILMRSFHTSTPISFVILSLLSSQVTFFLLGLSKFSNVFIYFDLL